MEKAGKRQDGRFIVQKGISQGCFTSRAAPEPDLLLLRPHPKSSRENETEKDLKIVALSATLPEGEPSGVCFVLLSKQKKRENKKKKKRRRGKKPDNLFLMLVTPKKNSHESVNAEKCSCRCKAQGQPALSGLRESSAFQVDPPHSAGPATHRGIKT